MLPSTVSAEAHVASEDDIAKNLTGVVFRIIILTITGAVFSAISGWPLAAYYTIRYQKLNSRLKADEYSEHSLRNQAGN